MPYVAIDLLEPPVQPKFYTLREHKKEVPNQYIYECTNDMQYLRQYFFIREYAYRLDLGLKHFSGTEDDIDQYSHFILARKGHFCVGGARLTISYPESRNRLPVEKDNFIIDDLLPELKDNVYCELGRTAILPEYRQGECLEEIFRESAKIAIDFGCTHMMGASPPAVARRFRSVYQNFGYPSAIRHDIPVPSQAIHEHVKLSFILVNLKP